MSLAEELLEQAQLLMDQHPTEPSQAALRRSISTAYYAVFHLLIDAASQEFISGQGRDELRAAVRRTFAHTRMAEASNAFVRGKHKLSPLLSQSPSSELESVGSAFVYLQDRRHRADYDTSMRFTLFDALLCLVSAHRLFVDWDKIKETEDARVYLVALLLWKDLRD